VWVQVDKINRPGRDLSLRKSLIFYIIIFAVLALILSVMTFSICGYAVDNIKSSYPVTGEKYYLTNEQGEQLGDGAFISDTTVPMSKQDERMIALLELLPVIAAPIYSALCIMAASLLFYRNKLKKPLTELRAASEKISNNDLDFSIEYDSKDELGQLCTSFEIMRTTLARNFSEMWRQVEERKQLNAAFAHDLRTPLTVLKGYNEMLQASENSQTRETAVTMGKHISRMENYVSSMSNLRRMEDTQPEYKLIDLQPLVSSLYDSAKIVCTKNGKELILQNDIPVLQLSLDSTFISQVCNNLISNAVRYARTLVTISFALHDNGLLLSVSDDGNGFDKGSLQKAANPYFTGESNHSEHFGLGLYICKLLCEHHNGYLQIRNTADGANVSAYFKSPTL
jgi:signal transduction histidine kinase